jgi:hypothetical protein
MAQLDISTAANVLKVFYLPPVREMLNNATILLSRIEKDSSTQDVTGKSFTVPLHTSRNEAAGVGRADGGTLPTAGVQGYGNAVVPNKYIYGRIQVTGPVIAATKNSAGAFVKAIESEMKGLMRDTKRSVNRQLHSNGLDILAYYKTGASGSSGTVDDGNGNAFVHLPSGIAVTVDLLDAGSSYVKLNTAVTLTAGTVNATDVDVACSGTISASAADNDPWVVAGTSLGHHQRCGPGEPRHRQPVKTGGVERLLEGPVRRQRCEQGGPHLPAPAVGLHEDCVELGLLRERHQVPALVLPDS